MDSAKQVSGSFTKALPKVEVRHIAISMYPSNLENQNC